MNKKQAVYVAILWALGLLLLFGAMLYYHNIGDTVLEEVLRRFFVIDGAATICIVLYLIVVGVIVLYEWLGDRVKK